MLIIGMGGQQQHVAVFIRFLPLLYKIRQVTLAEDILAGIDRKTSWHLGTTTDRDKLEVTAQRRAMVPGIHTIVWESDADTITIDHNAKNRSGFAMGAVLAAEYLADKRGTGKVYGMKDLLGF